MVKKNLQLPKNITSKKHSAEKQSTASSTHINNNLFAKKLKVKLKQHYLKIAKTKTI